MNQNHLQDDLAWLAFRYVAGELDQAEAEAFEQQLATDQAAREAVAQSVDLYHAVVAVEQSVPAVAVEVAPQKTSWPQRLAWLATGAAAAAVVIVSFWNAGGPINPPQPPVNRVSSDLAKAWTAVQADLALAREEAAEENERPAAPELSDAELAALVEVELSLPMDTPSWMTAAVQGLSSGKDQPLDAPESLPQEN